MRRVGGWLAFLGSVVVAVNFESVLVALGLDKLAADPSVWGVVAAAVTHPAVLQLSLVCFGFGLFLVMDRLARRWDDEHPTSDQLLCAMADSLSNLAYDIKREFENSTAPSIKMISKVDAKFTSLEKLGVRRPQIDHRHGRYWFAMNIAFFDVLVPTLREGHADKARELAAGMADDIANQGKAEIARFESQLEEEQNKRGWV